MRIDKPLILRTKWEEKGDKKEMLLEVDKETGDVKGVFYKGKAGDFQKGKVLKNDKHKN